MEHTQLRSHARHASCCAGTWHGVEVRVRARARAWVRARVRAWVRARVRVRVRARVRVRVRQQPHLHDGTEKS